MGYSQIRTVSARVFSLQLQLTSTSLSCPYFFAYFSSSSCKDVSTQTKETIDVRIILFIFFLYRVFPVLRARKKYDWYKIHTLRQDDSSSLKKKIYDFGRKINLLPLAHCYANLIYMFYIGELLMICEKTTIFFYLFYSADENH